MNELLQAALEYAGRGWAVFPCKPKGKAPATTKGVHDATTDTDMIRRWWSARPSCNIGVATGTPSGFWVLDLDGDAGRQSLAALETEHGALPVTLTATTGRGEHRLFSMPDGVDVRNGAGIRPGLDVRGTGGYIVAAPSVHPSGAVYAWTNLDTPVAESPRWLLDLVTPAAPANADALITAPPRSSDRATRYADRALADEVGRVIGAREGGRNHTLNRAAFALGQLVGGGVLGEEVVTDHLTRAARGAGLADGEIMPTIRSGIAAGRLQPRGVPKRKPEPVQHGTNGHAPEHVNDAPTPTSTRSWPATKGDLTDMGNAELFARQHAGRALYVQSWGWLVFDGKRWERDAIGAVMKLAKRTATSLWSMATAANRANDPIAPELAKHAFYSKQRGRLEAMLALAQSELPARAEDFDTDPLLLNCQNGTLDLRTFKLREHRPEDFITRITSAPYEPGHTMPMWQDTLARFQSPEVGQFLKRSFGLAVSGLTEKAFWFLYGPTGDNGKSTITGVIADVLGDYSAKISIDVLLSRHRGPGEEDQLARMAGARLVVANEVDERRLNGPLVKDLTGGMDKLRVKFMGEGTFEYKPLFKLFIYGNKRPKLDATDRAMWNRVQCVPFDRTIAKGDRIADYPDRLRAEHGAILAWLVDGYRAYKREGLNPPAAVAAATSDYQADMDTLGQFLEECCIADPKASAKFSDLKAAYERWAGQSIQTTELTKRLQEAGFEAGRMPKTGARIYRGVGLFADQEEGLGVNGVNGVNAISVGNAYIGDLDNRPELRSPRSPRSPQQHKSAAIPYVLARLEDGGQGMGTLARLVALDANCRETDALDAIKAAAADGLIVFEKGVYRLAKERIEL